MANVFTGAARGIVPRGTSTSGSGSLWDKARELAAKGAGAKPVPQPLPSLQAAEVLERQREEKRRISGRMGLSSTFQAGPRGLGGPASDVAETLLRAGGVDPWLANPDDAFEQLEGSAVPRRLDPGTDPRSAPAPKNILETLDRFRLTRGGGGRGPREGR